MTAPSFQSSFAAALSHYAAGRLGECEQACRAALSVRPNEPAALHLLGALAFKAGQVVAADELVRRAVAGRPGEASFRVTHAAILMALDLPRAAAAAAGAAVAAEPTLPEAHYNLGNACQALGDLPAAAAAHHRAATLRPTHAGAHDGLGVALQGLNRPTEAVAAHKRALSLDPNRPDFHYNLGNAHRLAGQTVAAMVAYQQAVRLAPHNWSAVNNLAGTLRELDRPAEAVVLQQRLVEADPTNARAFSNMGNALEDLGRRDEALAAHRRAVEIDPADPHGRWNAAVVLLRRGVFDEGWDQYEARWKCHGFPSPERATALPQWAGEPLAGRHVVVHDEQGFGDTIQFARYVPLVAAAGGRVTFEVAAELVRLMRDTPGADRVIARGDPWPAADFHCPLLSLPRSVGTTVSTIPAAPSRLWFDATAADRWQARLPRSGVRVGFVWSGRPTHLNDRNRSVPAHLLVPLMTLPGVVPVGLQKGGPPARVPAVDPTAELGDFADTAALVSTLDHVVAVDTAVAHLAASLGRPTHLLLPFNADYRWLLDRSDSPWYPSLQLYRQTSPGDWAPVIAAVAKVIGAPAASR